MDCYLDSELIILEVEKYPCLYDIRRHDFKNREIRNDAWMAVAKNVVGEEWGQMGEATKSIIGKEIQKRWKNMKDSYAKSIKIEAVKSDARRTKRPRPYIHQRQMNFLREIYGERSSGTASGEEEKDHIPLEPAVEIKEEPADYHPTPSTSTDTANEQFILPHEENSWTTPDTLVEPQFTLSVASLASPNAHLASPNASETSNDEQLKKKRKTKPSTITSLVPSTKPADVTPQSPVYNFGEVSNPGSSKEPRKDQLDAFGEYIIAKLRSLDRRSSTFAQKAIVDIIFEAEMGKFLKEDCEYKVLKYCAS
ncbi:hypothetical protein AVEN_55763-2 [Araneus ventricosus]|uniref:MADF domain-containing protein n=1 Tax=Araneus ventricosus TaxID=182803 RepID=A0A4Y2EYX1_ARAVE|nr:hypothetical protein AVEN_55763-2 [Araneus ventricosus]